MGKLNNAKNTNCFGCNRPKDKAKNPPPALRRQAAGGGAKGAAGTPAAAAAAKGNGQNQNVNQDPKGAGGGNGKRVRSAEQVEKRRLARDRRRAKKAEADGDAGQAAAAGNGADVDMGGAGKPAGAKGPAQEPKNLAQDEAAVLRTLGITAVVAMKELKNVFASPQEHKEEATAEEEVASVCKKNDALAAAIANEALYKASVEENTDVPGREHLLGVVKLQLEEWTKKVADLSKKPAGVGQAALSDLIAKRANEIAKEHRLKAATEADAERAAARYARLKAAVADQQTALTERFTALEEAYQASQALWAVDTQSRNDRHKQRVAAWDSRIAAAGGPAGVGEGAGATPPADSVDAGIMAAVQVARIATAHADCQLTIPWAVRDIPELQAPSPEALPILAAVNTNLVYWNQNGMFPVTFAQIYQGCDLTAVKTDAMTSVKEIVGEILWRRFYEGRNVHQDHYLPAQMGNILSVALGRISEQIQAGNKAEALKTSEKTFERLAEKDREDRLNAAGAYGSPY
jgi:hypothetical protein